MNSPTQALSLFDNMRAVARRVGTSMMATRMRAATAAFFRELWELLNAAANMRDDLRRMADECERSNPEQAARLRKLANSNWGQ